jgi:predicted nucleic acid-binding protein
VKFYFDTSVLVAASVQRHPHHAPAIQALDGMVSEGHTGCISAHGLAEVYAVLTRTPFIPAIYPGEAWQILEASILPDMEIVALSAAEYKDLVRQCAAEGQIGGRIYDWIHLRCAQKAKSDRLYTFNVKDFRALARDDFRDKVCTP